MFIFYVNIIPSLFILRKYIRYRGEIKRKRLLPSVCIHILYKCTDRNPPDAIVSIILRRDVFWLLSRGTLSLEKSLFFFLYIGIIAIRLALSLSLSLSLYIYIYKYRRQSRLRRQVIPMLYSRRRPPQKPLDSAVKWSENHSDRVYIRCTTKAVNLTPTPIRSAY